MFVCTFWFKCLLLRSLQSCNLEFCIITVILETIINHRQTVRYYFPLSIKQQISCKLQLLCYCLVLNPHRGEKGIDIFVVQYMSSHQQKFFFHFKSETTPQAQFRKDSSSWSLKVNWKIERLYYRSLRKIWSRLDTSQHEKRLSSKL